MLTNETHDPNLKCWIESANDPDTAFPIQNLPFCVFTAEGGDAHIGVGIGDQVLDMHILAEGSVLEGVSPQARCALCAPVLNDVMRLGRQEWKAIRGAAVQLLGADTATLRDNASLRAAVVRSQCDVAMHMPANIGDYTDFYASIHHATNVGSMFRPDNPLLPNYKHVPIGYHGRASSIVVSGAPIVRPQGQLKPEDGPPVFGPCRLLDYEMEMGFFVGPGNQPGSALTMSGIADHLFGMVIVNDWSARDIQKWEYQPLGPFNAKNFATTISPWVVTMEALAPFRVPGPPRSEDDPQPLAYLQAPSGEEGYWGIDMTVEVLIASEKMRADGIAPMRISRGNFRDMYWTIAQMLVHHASGGCNMRDGDLLATGTISNKSEDSRGCLLERTWRGEKPIDLPDGTQRRFLQDGDEVIMRAYCEREGARRIGFGECRGVVQPSH